MRNSRFARHRDRVSLVLVGVLLAALGAAPAAAQEARPVGSLKVSTAALQAVAREMAAAPAAGGAAQAPVADVTSFFRGTEFTGFVDFYYLYNFNTPTANNTLLRAFDLSHNSFSLNLAEIALEKKPSADDRAGYRIDFNYGPTAAVVNGGVATSALPNSFGTFENIQQAYFSYLAPIGKGLQFDFGKHVTQHGAEVIETRDNWNYSRSLLFTWAIPYHHLGVRASYPISDMVTFGAALNNGWNNTTDNNTGKTVGLGLAVKPISDLSLVANYMGGPEQNNNNSNWRNLIDTTVTYTLTPQVTLMANYDYGRESNAGGGTTKATWQGVGGYIKYQAKDWFALSPRFEYFKDSDGFTTGAAQKLKEVTVTADIRRAAGVRLLIEYRRDWSNINAWVQDAANNPVDHQDTLTLGLVYAFGTQ